MTADLRVAILAACDELSAAVVDLRMLAGIDRELTDDEVLLALHVWEGVRGDVQRVRNRTLTEWVQSNRRKAASQAAGGEE